MAKRKDIRVYAREWRIASDRTLEEVAGAAGMSVSYLSDLEKSATGEKNKTTKRWNVETLARVAGALKLDDPNDLFRHPAYMDPLLKELLAFTPEHRETLVRVMNAMLKKADK